LPSITDTQEFVVPKSIPIIFPISLYYLQKINITSRFTIFMP